MGLVRGGGVILPIAGALESVLLMSLSEARAIDFGFLGSQACEDFEICIW